MSDTRTDVKDRIEDMDDVHRTSPVGNGLRVVLKIDHHEIMTFTRLTDETGWYVAEYESGKNGKPDQFIIAPLNQ